MKITYKAPTIENVYFDEFFEKIPILAGKTMAITGTTSGIGWAAANSVAKKGAKVILLNRRSSRSEKMLNELQARNPHAKIIAIDCDLTSFESVRLAAKQVISACPEGLDALCNNAGIMAANDITTIDGFDLQMQTNHLSHFLLTNLLMPAVEKSS